MNSEWTPLTSTGEVVTVYSRPSGDGSLARIATLRSRMIVSCGSAAEQIRTCVPAVSIRRGVAITDDVENITGTAPGTFRQWCERHADGFR